MKLRSPCKSACQILPARLAAFAGWNCVDEVDASRHLPTTQARSQMGQQFSFGDTVAGNDTRRNFLIASLRMTAEGNCLTNPFVLQNFRFHFRWIHLLTGNIDQIRNASDNPITCGRSLKQIVRKKGSLSESGFIRFGEITVPDSATAHANPRGRTFRVEQLDIDALHRLANKSSQCLWFARVTNAATLRRSIERVNFMTELSAEGLRESNCERCPRGNAEP